MLEGIKSLGIPPGQKFFIAAPDYGNVNVDQFRLTNAIESSDALFKKLWILREIEENEMVSELEIPSLRTDFRTNQNPGSFRFGEPCCIAITLQKGEFFMEERHFDLDPGKEERADRFGQFHRLADENDFLSRHIPEDSSQPVHA